MSESPRTGRRPVLGLVAGQPEPRTTRWAFWALVLFAGAVPLEGIQHLGPLGSAPKVAGILAAAAVMVAVFTSLRPRPMERTFFLFGVFVVWVILSNFWSTVPTNTLMRTFTYLQMLGLAWIMWQQLRTPEKCEWMMRGYVAGTAVGSLYTVVARHAHSYGKANTQVARYSVGDPNSFGVYVVVGIVMAYHLFLKTTNRRVKAAYIAFMMLGVLAVFLTASRTAVVVLALAGLIVVADRRTLTPLRIAGLVTVTLVAAIVILELVTTSQLGRIGTVGSAAQSGFNSRTTYWHIAYNTFSHSPLVGVGADAFRDQSILITGISRVAHNSFLGVLADLGIIGLGLFMIALGSGWVQLPQLPRRLRQTWFAIFLCWILGANTLTWEHLKITWFLLFLLVAEVAAARHTEPAVDAPSPHTDHADGAVSDADRITPRALTPV